MIFFNPPQHTHTNKYTQIYSAQFPPHTAQPIISRGALALQSPAPSLKQGKGRISERHLGAPFSPPFHFISLWPLQLIILIWPKARPAFNDPDWLTAPIPTHNA